MAGKGSLVFISGVFAGSLIFYLKPLWFRMQKKCKDQIVKSLQTTEYGVKQIFQTASNRVIKLRFKPNEVYNSHIHVSDEYCFLVSGELLDNYGTKQAPCFFFNPEGSRHEAIRAGPSGCEIWVVKEGALPNTPIV